MVHRTFEAAVEIQGGFPCVAYFNVLTEQVAYYFTATTLDAHGMVRAHYAGEPVPAGLQFHKIGTGSGVDYHDAAMERRND